MYAGWGSEHPAAPLVLVLHGNGTSEHSLIEISPWLPHGPVAYMSVRGPLQRGKGYSWYDSLPDGGPDPADMAVTARWLLRWLEGVGDPERPVLLLGYREGVTFAGALMLAAPERFSGAALIYGALPEMPRSALLGMPVFLAHGTDDTRTPADQLDRTWRWLAAESCAPVWAERAAGGEQLVGDVVAHVGTWLGDRLDHIRAHGENPLPDGDEPAWSGTRLPPRHGPLPDVTSGIPQHQTSQNAPSELQEELWERIVALEGVTSGPAPVGVEGTRSLFLDRAASTGPDAAFLLPEPGEFAHLHPDGSVHVALPDELAYDALAKGWAVAHPLAGIRVSRGMVLVPGPRDEAELATVAAIVTAAHHHARSGPG
jgi:phospholipase/carboxylesterase